jgi:hypothetical protein
MTFDGRCIVVQVKDKEWVVAVPPIAQPGAYAVVTKPLGRVEAFKVCRELNEFEPTDFSELTRAAIHKPWHDDVRHV